MIPHSRPTLGDAEKKACLDVLDSLQIAQGERVAELEKTFCRLIGRRYAIAVSSGTAALTLSLSALGISKADEVILPSFTCAALLHAINAVGATPVPVDIDLEDFNISVSETKKKIGRKTRAIIVPHAFGRGARMIELLALGITVIEDGTQALGARVGGNKVGSMGTISIFSFYATKMITTGEGGMVLTNSSRLAESVFDVRDYDKKKIYRSRTNSKMTDLEAAIGIEQVRQLPLFIKARRKIAAGYDESFGGLDLVLPRGDADRSHVYYRYVVQSTGNASSLIRGLNAVGIEAKQPIFKPIHRYLKLPDSHYPLTAKAMKTACSLPIFPSFDSSDQRQVCEAVSRELEKDKEFLYA